MSDSAKSSRKRARKPSPAASPNKTLGPVADLERHLPRDWWKTLFNAVYLKTDGDVVENAQITRDEVDAVVRLAGLEKGDHVLDLCCGQGRHVLELARRGFLNLHGYDRSSYLIRLARRRASAEGLRVGFREGDARKPRFPASSLDCVLILGNSFGYFEQAEDDLRVLRNVHTCLRSGGRLLLDLTDGDWMRGNFQARSWEWIDQSQFVCRERSLAADGRRLISREVVVDSERGVIADQFYAERLYARDEIRALLERAGYVGVELHDGYRTDSDRGQDLGMMEQRFLWTARVPEKASAPSRRVPFPKVTVLLGDPRLPDPVKLGGHFNPEDLATVQRLKDSLSELEEYRFSYWDEHATWLSRLQKSPPDFVLNLCDEGFHNAALKELHVPALLELLQVPYTGAGPTCLGLCFDKSMVRSIAQDLDIPVPMETFIAADDQGGTLPSVFPALIKPAQGDSSIGITSQALVRDATEALAYLAKLRDELPGRAVLVQEYLSGAEYSVTLIGNPGQGFTVLPVLEVDYSRLDPGLPPILSYESKWQPDSPYWTQIQYKRSEAPDEIRKQLVDHSARLFERFACRDYARFDFRADAEGRPKLLEINPNPGWCWDGKMNLMAGMAGISYAGMLRLILEAAQWRVESEGI